METFQTLKDRFKIRHMGIISEYLGIQFDYIGKDKLLMHQEKYTKKICDAYLKEEETPVPTPMNPRTLIKAFDPEVDTDCPMPKYRAAIGGLLWLARCTRPDIAFSVSLLAQHQLRPSMVHWGAVRHLIRYLRGTLYHGIVLNRTRSGKCILKADASFADPQRGYYSTTGILLMVSGSPILWISRKQGTVAQHTLEAEFLSAAEGIKVILWLTNIISSLPASITYMIPFKPVLESDSISTTKLIENGDVDAKGLRHVRVRERLFLHHYQAGLFDLRWVPGLSHIVDLLTKNLKEVDRFKTLRQSILSDGNQPDTIAIGALD